MSSAFALSTRKCLPGVHWQAKAESKVVSSQVRIVETSTTSSGKPQEAEHGQCNGTILLAHGCTPLLNSKQIVNSGVGEIPSIISRSSRLPDILNYEGDIKLLPHRWFINIPCYFELCSAAEFCIHALNCNGCRPAGQGDGEDGRGFTETGTDPPSQKKSSLPTGF